jgi:hypothetical protein
MRKNISGLVLACLLASASVVQAAGEYLEWQALSPGGSFSFSSSGHSQGSTVGLPATGFSSSSSLRCVAGFWQDFSLTGGGGGCCVGRVGDADGHGIYPDEVTLGDIMFLVDVKFVTGECSILPCIAEGDVNQDGGVNPNCDDHVSLGDIMTLVDFLFITGPENATLRDCL